MRQMKVLFLGKSYAGKSSILRAHQDPAFTPDPTAPFFASVFDSFSVEVRDERQRRVNVTFWDTGEGNEFYPQLAALSFGETDVYVLCVSVTEELSLRDIREHYGPTIQHYGFARRQESIHRPLEGALTPYARVVLVGTKIDLRTAEEEEGEEEEEKDQDPEERKKPPMGGGGGGGSSGHHGFSREQLEELGQEFGADAVVENSCLTREGLDETFQTIPRFGFEAVAERRRHTRLCSVM